MSSLVGFLVRSICIISTFFGSAPDFASAQAAEPAKPASRPVASQPSPAKKKTQRKTAATESIPTATTSQPTAEGSLTDQLESEEAAARYQQVLQRKPLHGPAFTGLVKHYVEQGRLKELVSEYEQKHKALRNESSFQIILARLYLRVGEANKSSELIEALEPQANMSADDQSKLLVLKSEIFQQTGRAEKAISILKLAKGQAKSLSERLKLTEALADLY